MTQPNITARKIMIYVIAGIGVAALLGSYAVGHYMPNNGLFALLLTAVFIGCVFIAGRMAFKLNKETASR